LAGKNVALVEQRHPFSATCQIGHSFDQGRRAGSSLTISVGANEWSLHPAARDQRASSPPKPSPVNQAQASQATGCQPD